MHYSSRHSAVVPSSPPAHIKNTQQEEAEAKLFYHFCSGKASPSLPKNEHFMYKKQPAILCFSSEQNTIRIFLSFMAEFPHNFCSDFYHILTAFQAHSLLNCQNSKSPASPGSCVSYTDLCLTESAKESQVLVSSCFI